MTQKLISFHGKQEIKDAKISDLQRHKILDQFVQGTYYDKNTKKGCAVGCTMYSPEDFETGNVSDRDIHARFETALGIPQIIARLEDRIFEGLSVAESKNWPLDFITAVPVGVDLEPVWRKFMIWLLIDDAEGVVKFAKNEKTIKAIRDVAAAFETSLTTIVPRDKWLELRKAAYAAAYAAAADAAYAAAADAADAAAADAAYAAYAAADAADAAAADAAAADAAAAAAYARTASRRGHFSKMAAKLIELLKAAA